MNGVELHLIYPFDLLLAVLAAGRQHFQIGHPRLLAGLATYSSANLSDVRGRGTVRHMQESGF